MDDARRRLAEQRRALDSVASSAPAKASAGKADQVGKDLAAQIAAVQKTESGFATPPSAGPSESVRGAGSPSSARAKRRSRQARRTRCR